MKPCILAVWDYHSAHLVAPFEALGDRFRFTYLAHVRPAHERRSAPRRDAVYYADFPSARALLEHVRPDAIVFMGIAGYQILVREAARQLGIPTALMQHGLFTDRKHYEAIAAVIANAPRSSDASERAAPVPSGSRRTRLLGLARQTLAAAPHRLWLAGFSARSLFPHSLDQLPGIARFQYRVARGDIYTKTYLVEHGRFRRPDRFICYTDRNARLYGEVYGAGEADTYLIGNPGYDAYLAIEGERAPGPPYVLLIDSPLTQNRYGVEFAPRAQVTDFYARARDWAAARGAELWVKLHPESYDDTWRPRWDGVRWLKDVPELPRVMRDAESIISFPSTLIVPAAYLRPTLAVTPYPHDVTRRLGELGVAIERGGLDFDFDAVDLGSVRREGPAWETFIREYLHAETGSSGDRLGEALEDLVQVRATAT